MHIDRPLHIPMRSTTKRLIFFFLFFLFTLYTCFIAGTVTNNDRGKDFLTAQAREGKLLFQKHNCISCHQVYGLGGYMGPDLTNVISAKGKGENYVNALLKYGTIKMPNFHLNDTEIKNITSYLIYLDKTGMSPVREFTININGSCNIGQ